MARLLQWLSPGYRRSMAKRRLEQVAIQCGASRSVAKKIVMAYFAKSLHGGK